MGGKPWGLGQRSKVYFLALPKPELRIESRGKLANTQPALQHEPGELKMSSVTDSLKSPPQASISELIQRVRDGGTESLGELLSLYRDYLNVLAATQVTGRLGQRVNASDMVQETMLEAHRGFGNFRGGSEGELVAWLRQILSNAVSHAVGRHIHAKKRDVRREISINALEHRADHSSGPMMHLLADHGTTPSENVGRKELAAQLSVQLAKLKPDYRDVIVYRNLDGLSFDEIAQKMGRRAGSTRMLWIRAIAKFKELCPPIE